MPTRPLDTLSPTTLRPFSLGEVDRCLVELEDAIARLTRGTGRGPRILAPADLLRCLAPILSRN